MISFFRRALSSWPVLALLGLILVAFVITGFDPMQSQGGSLGGKDLASIGSKTVSETEAIRRTQTQLDAARQENPNLDMATFVAGGGAERTIDQIINGRALEAFAARHGLIASRKLVDGAIASIPAFNGPNGQFDRGTFQNILAQRKIPEAQLREDFAREAVTKALLVPVAGAPRVPTGVVTPYATLLLESRQGQVAVVPTQAFASSTPVSDADVTAFYNRNLASYTVPERRTIKYAQFDRTRFDGKVTPSEAEIAAAFKANAAKYAGRETRGFTQIIVQKQADAEALMAKVKSGLAMDAAAKSVGLEALSVQPADKAAFEKLTGPRVAEAAFAAPRGSWAAIAQSGLGFHVVRIDSVTAIAARTLDQVRGELVADLTKVKVDEAMADFVAKIDDDISGGATFDDIAKTYGFAATTTPAITAGGIATDDPQFVLPELVKPLLRDAFQAETSDDPQVSSIGNGNTFVVYHMDRVIAAAPRPLTAIRAQVAADAEIDRAARAAKRVADAIVASINKGTGLAQAMAGAGAGAGVKLPAPKPAGGRRIEIAQAGEKVPPPVALMFSMAEKRAKVLAAPQGAGWFIVYLDKIIAGDAKAAQPLVAATQQQLSRVIGDEYVAQFAAAVKASVGVKRNDAAIAAFKQALTGGTSR